MDRHPRHTDSEAMEIIQKISAIKDMFREDGESIVLARRGAEDSSAGFLYLSRFNKNANQITKKESEEDHKESGVVDNNDVEEAAQVDVTIKPTQNREKKRRFAMSLASLASKAEKRVEIVNDGAIQTLNSLSTVADDVIQLSCSVAYAQLSKERNVRQKMIDESSISAIIALSNSNSHDVKANCCKALCNICCETGSEYKAVKDGAAFTITHIASVCPDIIDVCLKILLNLSCVVDKYPRLEDVSEALMHFNTLPLTPNQDIIILCTLCNLSALRNNQLRLVEDGCLRIVERAISSDIDLARKLGSDVIRNLTTCHKTRGKLLEQSIIKMLLLMAKDNMEEVRTLAIKALYNLSRDVACRVKIVAGNAVSVILKICMEKFTNVDMGRTAAKTLRILCGDLNTAHKLISDGIVRALMSLLRTDDGVIQQYCAESICALFQMEDVLDRLVEQGAVSVIVSLSHNNTDMITGEWCAFALYHLSTSRVCSIQMLEQGVLPCLIKLCASSTTRTRCFCSAALVHITLNKRVDSSGAIPVLVHMLRTEPDKTTKTNCATALYNLADNDANCHVMLDVGALLPVVTLTKSDFIQTKVKCAAILSRLSLHEQYYHLFAADGVLSVLLDLSCVEHVLTQRRVVIALSNLSQHPQLRAQLLELNPIRFIISLAAKRDENLWRGCVSIICNLSYDPGSEKSLVQGGIVPTLLITALINSDFIITKTICVKALLNLLADYNLLKTMVKEGVIWALSSLGLLDDMELLTLCANALCRLSIDFARDMIESTATIKTVVKLINQSDVRLLRVGGRILTNILLKSTDQDEAFRRHIVENMANLARCRDEEVIEMCILCLCLSSQSESCRTTIVSSGVLLLMDASNIFTLPRVSYAYLTMFGNIANNPEMRTELLDEQSISRFQQICLSGDPNLDLAVAKAIYYITCAPENIVKLASQNIIPVIETIWRSKYKKSMEIIHHMIAILYNMCIYPDVQNKLVCQGAVHAFVDLWPSAKEDVRLCKLVCSAICHLGCGNVNTNRMIQDGCAEILIFLTEFCKSPTYSTYFFETDIYERYAASMRNLLHVVPNQASMIECGCLQSLVDMFGMATKFQSQGLSIRKNIAAALRSLTFNSVLREEVLRSGAIRVILADLSSELVGDEQLLSQNLMKELEAESWSNGSRGNLREGRAAPIAPASMYTDLLRSTMNVQLDVDLRHAHLEKYHVQIQLDEPKIDVQESSQPILDLTIADLASYEDGDESNAPITQQCPKQECLIGDEVINFFLSELPSKSSCNELESKDDSSLLTSQPSLPELKKGVSSKTSSTNKLNPSSSSSDLPKLNSSHKLTEESMKSSMTSSVKPSRRKMRPNPEEKFKNIVQMIKHSKSSKAGVTIEDVVREWHDYSKK